MRAIRTITLILLAALAVSNFVSGFLYLFPGLFEVASSRIEAGSDAPSEAEPSSSVKPSELIRGRYGATAVALLALAAVQLTTAYAFGVLLSLGSPFVWTPIVVGVLGALAELWGWHLKSSLSPFNIFGLMVSALLVVVSLQAVAARQTA